MKKLLDYFPFILLSTAIPYALISQPSTSQSIIISVLVLFCAFQAYLLEKRQPDYEKKFEKALMFLEQEIKKVDKKTGEIRAEVTKVNVDKLNNNQALKKFQF